MRFSQITKDLIGQTIIDLEFNDHGILEAIFLGNGFRITSALSYRSELLVEFVQEKLDLSGLPETDLTLNKTKIEGKA